MKSIRQQLTLGLLLGFFLLLGAGGAAIHHWTRTALLDQFDAALTGKAMAMAGAIKQEGDKLEIEFRDNTKPVLGGTNLTEFYEVCVIGSNTVRKSRSLGKAELPRQFGPIEAPRLFDMDLPGGTKGRAIGIRFVPRWDKRGKPSERSPPEMGLALAHDRSKLDASIAALRTFVLLAGALTLLATVVLVALVLARALAPLERLASQAESIDASSLQKRFPIEGMPMELSPISQRLNDLLARLERSFNDISEYAAKVAHELRTPLTILRLKVEQAGGRMPPELAEDLHAELHHLTHVVDQSLLIAKAEQGRLKVRPRNFDLAALVADVAEDFSLLAQEKDRRVQFEPAGPCEVCADPKYVRQIIHNLLSNALKHGCGDIVISMSPGAQGCELTLSNSVLREATSTEETLGLGLRVVETLLTLHRGVKCERHRDKQHYEVRLTFPPSATGGSELTRPAAS